MGDGLAAGAAFGAYGLTAYRLQTRFGRQAKTLRGARTMSLQPRGDHRILYVSDPSSITTNVFPDPTEPDDIRRWVDTLADSGVDTYNQEVWSQGWTAYWRSENYEYERRIHHRRYIPMLDRGIAPIQIVIEQARKR